MPTPDASRHAPVTGRAISEARAQFEAALITAADALAVMMTTQPARWRAMCRQAREITTLTQYHAAIGVADELIPQGVLGSHIITLLSECHPKLCTDDATTTG